MNENKYSIWSILSKTTVIHTITYFLMGIIAFTLFNYTEEFASGALSGYMRPTDHPMVMAGVLFQPLRGILFGVVFFLLRDILFSRKNGWLIAWIMLVFVGILSTFGAAPGSIEGFVYTKLGISQFGLGMIEVFGQAFLLSVLTYQWVNHPEKKWQGWVYGIVFAIGLILPVMGLLVTQ
ncbi:MAG: hypothetical protein JEZ00_08630 [Anaerolineaceae bacterium]|nr:hypothetical protein [Anaerolineaceae bacterium]